MTCVRPNSIAPLAEMLRLNGYGTAMFGKSHELPPWELSVSGPLDRWPVHSGFDKFYGFLQGESDLYSPVLYDGVTRIPTPRDPDTTSAPTSPTRQSSGSAPSSRSRRTSRSSSTTRRRARTIRITCPRNGSPSTRASSTRAGTSSARRSWPGRSRSASFRRTRRSHRCPKWSSPGARTSRRSSGCWRARWRSMRAWPSTPTTRSAA